MRVYWIDGARKRVIKYHNTFNLATAMNVREVQVRYGRSEIPRSRFSNSREIYAAFRDDMMSCPAEVFRAVFLNSKNMMISFEDISRGSLTGAVVMPREAFWSAIHFRSAKGHLDALRAFAKKISPGNGKWWESRGPEISPEPENVIVR